MSQVALHTLVGTALIDRKFCADLLNGRRHTLLAEFDLSDEEQEIVLGVEAESIQEFAAQLGEWLKVQEGLISHPPTEVSVPYLPLRSSVGPAFWQ
jgi:hypothetical protein